MDALAERVFVKVRFGDPDGRRVRRSQKIGTYAYRNRTIEQFIEDVFDLFEIELVREITSIWGKREDGGRWVVEFDVAQPYVHPFSQFRDEYIGVRERADAEEGKDEMDVDE